LPVAPGYLGRQIWVPSWENRDLRQLLFEEPDRIFSVIGYDRFVTVSVQHFID